MHVLAAINSRQQQTLCHTIAATLLFLRDLWERSRFINKQLWTWLDQTIYFITFSNACSCCREPFSFQFPHPCTRWRFKSKRSALDLSSRCLIKFSALLRVHLERQQVKTILKSLEKSASRLHFMQSWKNILSWRSFPPTGVNCFWMFNAGFPFYSHPWLGMILIPEKKFLNICGNCTSVKLFLCSPLWMAKLIKLH